MTLYQSEPMRMAQWQIACSLLLAIASTLFRRALDLAEPGAGFDELNFAAWRSVRRAAEQVLWGRSTHLSEAELESVRRAIFEAHRLSHLPGGCEAGCETCQCATAVQVRDLLLLFAKEEVAI